MQNTKWGKLREKKLGEPLLWLLVHLVISRFIVKSLFSVPMDVAITLIVNHVNFSVWFSLLFVWIFIVSLLFFDLCFRCRTTWSNPPTRLFWYKARVSRVVQFTISNGILPDNWLPRRINSVNLVSIPIRPVQWVGPHWGLWSDPGCIRGGL